VWIEVNYNFWGLIGLIFIHLTVECTGCVSVLGSKQGSPVYFFLWLKTAGMKVL
ncbi:unnamed protein product, partial [Allacma fusca]